MIMMLMMMMMMMIITAAVCEPYTYGVRCDRKCGHCRLKQACNMVTGVCSAGCQAGWQGKQCIQSKWRHTLALTPLIALNHFHIFSSLIHNNGESKGGTW